MKLEEYIFEVFDQAERGRHQGALLNACIAIDAAAGKHCGVEKATRSHYKKFIRDSYWVIEPFIGGGLNLDDTKFPDFVNENDDGKTIREPDFADFIYHVYRCTLAHGKEIQKGFEFTTSNDGNTRWEVDVNGEVKMPDTVIWGLVAAIVFNKTNRGVVTNSPYYLTWRGYYFNLDLFWGEELLVRSFFERQNFERLVIDFKEAVNRYMAEKTDTP